MEAPTDDGSGGLRAYEPPTPKRRIRPDGRALAEPLQEPGRAGYQPRSPRLPCPWCPVSEAPPYLILGHYYVTPDGIMSDLLSVSKSDIGGNAIVYSYPNGDFDVICAAEKTFLPPGWESSEDYSRPGKQLPLSGATRKAGAKSEGDDRLRSARRARAKLRRLALSNDFEWFVTLTLAPDEVDRYDAAAIMKRVNRWLDNMVRRRGLRYVLVPERHQDGAFHFHGFFAGAGLEAVPSGHSDRQGHPVYNLPQWTFGFTAAIRLYGTYSQAVGYVTKYVGKQDGERPMGRWYYSGGDLREPDKLYATLDYEQLGEQFRGEAVEFAIPGTMMKVIHHRKENENG